jgi:radical SAM protein with 4Fe4S-binding SPASM domain
LDYVGHIDEPAELEDVGSTIRVIGWALTADQEELELYLDHVLLGAVHRFIDRKDVRSIFPAVSVPKATGFDQIFAVPETPDGPHTLQLRSTGNGTTRVLCVRNVRYTDGFDGLLRIVSIDMSRMCNFRCEMCPAHSRKAKHIVGRLTADDGMIDRILPLLRNPRYRIRQVAAGAIYGEPLMNPRYFENTRKMAEACPRAIVSLTTNGSFLTPQNIDRLLDFGRITWVCVSVDAGTKETYERIREGGKWEILITNLSRLIAERTRRRLSSPVVSTNFIVMKSNFRELPLYVKKMANLGVDFIGAGNAFNVFSSDLDQGIFDTPWKVSEVAEERERVLRQALSIDLPHGTSLQLPSFIPNKRSVDCSYQNWSRILVDIEGEVYPCCIIQYLGHEGRAEARPMGNVFEQELDSIWESKQYVDFRLRMLRGEAPNAICLTCPSFYGM